MQDFFIHFDGTPTHSLAVLLNADLIQDDIQRSAFDVVQPTWLVQHSKSLGSYCQSAIHREKTAFVRYQKPSVRSRDPVLQVFPRIKRASRDNHINHAS